MFEMDSPGQHLLLLFVVVLIFNWQGHWRCRRMIRHDDFNARLLGCTRAVVVGVAHRAALLVAKRRGRSQDDVRIQQVLHTALFQDALGRRQILRRLRLQDRYGLLPTMTSESQERKKKDSWLNFIAAHLDR